MPREAWRFLTLAQVRGHWEKTEKLLAEASSEGKQRRPIMNDLHVILASG